MLGFDIPGVAAARSISPGPAPFSVPGLPRWSAAVRAMQAGQRNARILCLGDSTTSGSGAYGAGMGYGNKAGSWPSQLAGLLSGRGLRASRRSFLGNQNAPDVRAYDTRISFPAETGWSVSAGVSSATVGGYFIGTQGNSTLSFDPGGVVDTFEVFYALTGVVSALSLAVDGGPMLETVSTSRGTGVNRIARTVLSVPRGAHVLNVYRPADATVVAYLAGVVASDSRHREISVLNGGWSGSSSGDLANTAVPWTTPFAIADHRPDLVILCIGINDFNNGSPTGETTFKANVQSLISASVTAGADVLLAIPNAISGAYASNHAAFAGYITDLATANGLNPPIDFRTALGATQAEADVAGYMRDTAHANATGYGRMADLVRRAIS